MYDFIDIYCERVDESFWSEPINAISNLAFIIGALVAWRYASQRGYGNRWSVIILVAIIVTIGIGSFLFHTFAQFWSMLADVIPISFFMYGFLWCAMRVILRAGIAVSIGALVAFLAASFGFPAILAPYTFNGSVGYFGALATIPAIGFLALHRSDGTGQRLLGLALLFLVSVSFRSIDQQVCPTFEHGVHWLWHLLNGVLLSGLVVTYVRALALNESKRDEHG